MEWAHLEHLGYLCSKRGTPISGNIQITIIITLENTKKTENEINTTTG